MEIVKIKILTPYQDINDVLVLLSQDTQEILGDNLVGLYLTGSLTYGDFNLESSDIDFLTVLKKELLLDKLEEIRTMHKKIAEAFPKWSHRIEGSYITEAMLNEKGVPKNPRPYVNEDNIRLCEYGNEWMLNLYVLYENGIALYGPDPKDYFKPVSIEKVREASKKDLLEEWEPKLNDEAFFKNTHYKAYLILTLCRILHRAHSTEVASKKVASTWAKKEYPQWKELIETAENWKHGVEFDKADDVKDFIKFTINQIQQ